MNEIRIEGEVAFLQLNGGNVCVIDAADVPLVERLHWRAKRSGFRGKVYVYTMRETIPIHRVILGLTDPGVVVDHIDMDPMNCRRSNLRVCVKRENNANRPRQTNNTSGFIGIKRERSGRWAALVYVGGKRRSAGGTFGSPFCAAAARDLAMLQAHGDFASLNFPGLRDAAQGRGII